MAHNFGNVEWTDKKRFLGMPISLTRYSIVSTEDNVKLYIKTGLLFTREEEISLYRIYDLTMTSTLGEKLCGVGTITLYSRDESTPTMQLLHIKHPREVRSLIATKIEEEKMKRGFRVAEFN